jgi:hypothetical protein
MSTEGKEAITVWWMDIIVVALLILGVYGFLVLTGFEKRVLTRKTSRTAESMYDQYADPVPKQRRRPGQHDDG